MFSQIIFTVLYSDPDCSRRFSLGQRDAADFPKPGTRLRSGGGGGRGIKRECGVGGEAQSEYNHLSEKQPPDRLPAISDTGFSYTTSPR